MFARSSAFQEDARRSHRERLRLLKERTAHINRIKGLLFAQGIRGVEPQLRRTRIDFSTLRTGEGLPLPDRLRAELKRESARLDLVEIQLRAAETERDTADMQHPCVERTRDMLMVAAADSVAVMAEDLVEATLAASAVGLPAPTVAVGAGTMDGDGAALDLV